MDVTDRQLVCEGVAIDAGNPVWQDLFHAEWLSASGQPCGNRNGFDWRTDDLLPDAEMVRLLGGEIASNTVETVRFSIERTDGSTDTVLMLGAVAPDCRYRYRVIASSLVAASRIAWALGSPGCRSAAWPSTREEFAVPAA